MSPLKALDNDIHRNLEPALEALNAALRIGQKIQMEVRTGDTALADRQPPTALRPHLILTTPETLSSILSQAAWKENGFDPDTVIVDEIHSFAENKRGSLLALCLERWSIALIVQFSASESQRRPGPSKPFNGCCAATRPCAIAKVDIRKLTSPGDCCARTRCMASTCRI